MLHFAQIEGVEFPTSKQGSRGVVSGLTVNPKQANKNGLGFRV